MQKQISLDEKINDNEVLLHWAGKRPLEERRSFIPVLMDIFDPFHKYKDLSDFSFESLQQNWHNLLFNGDNKDILATLLDSGFEGKITLIYIDPPFGSGAHYFKTVNVGNAIDVSFKQTTYSDVWRLPSYLQFMYERLLLLKRLLSEDGSIYVHLDWNSVHYVKVLMDEVFGSENFLSEIVWYRYNKLPDKTKKTFFKMHDTILLYAKHKDSHYFNPIVLPTDKKVKRRKIKKINGKIAHLKELVEYTQEMLLTKSVIDFIPDVNIGSSNDKVRFVTQKPEKLIELFVSASSRYNDIVLDCFLGSGTTIAVAQRLGRRWIGCDINPSSVNLAKVRIVKEQIQSNASLFSSFTYPFATYVLDGSKTFPEDPVSISIRRIRDKARIEISNFELVVDDKPVKGLSLISCILIDTNYNGKAFRAVYSYVADKINSSLQGSYEVPIGFEETKVAVKIIDVLGREFFFAESV